MCKCVCVCVCMCVCSTVESILENLDNLESLT